MTTVAAQKWRTNAACLSPAVNPLWFDDTVHGEDPEQQRRRHELAREVCGTCTVRDSCYAEGRTRREEGVYGGRLMPKKRQGPPSPNPRPRLSDEQRKARRNERRSAVKECRECGETMTAHALQTHRKRVHQEAA